ncbi:MAG: MBL fold metallo-hydrolase [Clostridiales bacterium]|nr:MBL fold metallo-hydrolase [Clostridiales bacterium]
MKITWIGHSCFKIEKSDVSIITDPYADGSVPGLRPVREEANMVLCSHEHSDHNGRETVKLINQANDLFQIQTIDTYHDDVQGAKRGKNRIFIIDDGENRIAHLGDLGCELAEEQIEELKYLDVVMIPVGGYYTIDGEQAAGIIKRLKPGIVLPMHYRNDADGYGFDVIGTVDDFTKYFDDVVTVCGSEMDTADFDTGKACNTTAMGTKVVILRPANRKKG